jgi:excisionase family DNA binding protein
MNDLILSPIPLSELATVIQTTVQREFERIHNSQTPQPENEYITRKETCQILGISLPTLNDYSKRGLLPSYRIGSRIRYKKEEVFNSINERQFCRKAIA